jgi:hypothetical protein
MRAYTFPLFLILPLVACQGPTPSSPAREDEPIAVSIYQLIATPEKFDGKLVRLKGYLHLEFEGNGLYAHKEDFDRSLHKNGFWINVSDCGYGARMGVNDDYVLVEARFDSQNHGHMGLFSGSLFDVTRCEILPRRDPGSASNNSFKPTPLRGAA